MKKLLTTYGFIVLFGFMFGIGLVVAFPDEAYTAGQGTCCWTICACVNGTSCVDAGSAGEPCVDCRPIGCFGEKTCVSVTYPCGAVPSQP